MKKPKNYTFVMYGIMLTIAFGLGYALISFFGDEMGTPYPGVVAVGFYFLSFILTSLLYGIGHIIFAKASGYKVVSFNVLGVEVGQVDGKVKFFFNSHYSGFVGETRVIPTKEKVRPSLYFAGGFLTCFIFDAILLILNLTIPAIKDSLPILYFGIFYIVSLSILMITYAMLPLNIDSVTGGVAMKCIKKNGYENFNELCKVQNSIRQGERLVNLPLMEEVNPLISDYSFYAFNSYIYIGQYEKAAVIIDNLIEKCEDVSVVNFDRIIPNKFLIEFCLHSKEECLDFYNNKLDNESRNKLNRLENIESARAYLVLCGLVLDNEVATNKAVKSYAKYIMNIMEKGVRQQEQEFADSLLEEIAKAHPEWTVNW